MLNSTYNDQAFIIKSLVSPNKKKCLICYIRNYDIHTGYCSIYNIDENKFENYNKYLSQMCGTTINYISFDYFKETNEYIFTCSTDSSAHINIVRFDQNFDIIKINDTNDTFILVNSTCQVTICYSLVFSSYEYKVISQFECNGVINVDIFPISDEYKPLKINTYLPEIENTDKPEIENTDKPEIENTDKPELKILMKLIFFQFKRLPKILKIYLQIISH